MLTSIRLITRERRAIQRSSRGAWIPPRRVAVLLLAIGVGCGSLALWKRYEDSFSPKRWGVVTASVVFRSGQLHREMLGRVVEEHGISTIVDMQMNDIQDPLLQDEMVFSREHGLAHYRFGLGGDGTGDVTQYADALAIIIDCKRRGKPVLVHCAAGAQRTGGIVACYRLFLENARPADIRSEMQTYGWETDDVKLVNFLNRRMTEIAVLLVERGLIAEVPAVLPKL